MGKRGAGGMVGGAVAPPGPQGPGRARALGRHRVCAAGSRSPSPALALAERWAGTTWTPLEAGVAGEEGKKEDAGVGGLCLPRPPPTVTPEPSLASPAGDTAGSSLPEEPRAGGGHVSCTDVPQGSWEARR